MSQGRTSVVAARFSNGGTVARLVTKTLDETELVDAAPGDDSPAAWKLVGATITRLDEPGLSVRLKFPEQVGLRVRRVDMKLW
jgi:hypothetical protein